MARRVGKSMRARTVCVCANRIGKKGIFTDSITMGTALTGNITGIKTGTISSCSWQIMGKNTS